MSQQWVDHNGQQVVPVDTKLCDTFIPSNISLACFSTQGAYFSSAVSTNYKQEVYSILYEIQPKSELHSLYAYSIGVTSSKVLSNRKEDFKVIKFFTGNANQSTEIDVFPIITGYGFSPWFKCNGLVIPSTQTLYAMNPVTDIIAYHLNPYFASSCGEMVPESKAKMYVTTDLRRGVAIPMDQSPFAEGNTVYPGLGPVFWDGKFDLVNKMVKSYHGGVSQIPFLWQDYGFRDTGSVAYHLTKAGALVDGGIVPAASADSGGSIASDWLVYFPNIKSDGIYEFSLDDLVYKIDGQTMKSKVLATSDTSKPDPNPPSIKRLYHFTDDHRSEVYRQNKTNRLQFEFDAVGGNISQVALKYGIGEIPTNPIEMSSNAGVYSAILPVVNSGSLASFSLEVQDDSGNKLNYTFQMPIGE